MSLIKVKLLSKYPAKVPSLLSATLIFNDTPSDDFSSLARTIDDNVDQLSSNGRLSANVLMAPQSYFWRLMPSGSVHVGFCSTALNWLQHMPDDSADTTTLAAAAHQDLLTFLSARHKEISVNGTLVLCIPIQGEISVANSFVCLETALLNLHATYKLDPKVIYQLPEYFRTEKVVLLAITSAQRRWRLKAHHTLTMVHPSWSSLISDGESVGIRKSACEKYAHEVTGFALAALSYFWLTPCSLRQSQENTIMTQKLLILPNFWMICFWRSKTNFCGATTRVKSDLCTRWWNWRDYSVNPL